MAVFLVGLVGYPLMYTTISAEGDQSDTFDALSRSINYVYQSPWHYIWYWIVAVVYGAAVTLLRAVLHLADGLRRQVGGRPDRPALSGRTASPSTSSSMPPNRSAGGNCSPGTAPTRSGASG